MFVKWHVSAFGESIGIYCSLAHLIFQPRIQNTANIAGAAGAAGVVGAAGVTGVAGVAGTAGAITTLVMNPSGLIIGPIIAGGCICQVGLRYL